MSIKDLICNAKLSKGITENALEAYLKSGYILALKELDKLCLAQVEFDTGHYGYTYGHYVIIQTIGNTSIDQLDLVLISFYDGKSSVNPIAKMGKNWKTLPLVGDRMMILDILQRYIKNHYLESIKEYDQGIQALNNIYV
jgi:hypothetical protein